VFGAADTSTAVSTGTWAAVMIAASSRMVSPSDPGWFGPAGWPCHSRCSARPSFRRSASGLPLSLRPRQLRGGGYGANSADGRRTNRTAAGRRGLAAQEAVQAVPTEVLFNPAPCAALPGGGRGGAFTRRALRPVKSAPLTSPAASSSVSPWPERPVAVPANSCPARWFAGLETRPGGDGKAPFHEAQQRRRCLATWPLFKFKLRPASV
jgi:hypothetical protein